MLKLVLAATDTGGASGLTICRAGLQVGKPIAECRRIR